MTAVVTLACGWLAVSNIIDSVLLYLVILPGGLADRWSVAAESAELASATAAPARTVETHLRETAPINRS